MLLIYGACNCNSRAAQHLYGERHPGRNLPNPRTFVVVDRRMRETGSLEARRPDAGRQRTVRTPMFEEAILEEVENKNNPSVSSRHVAHRAC
ncbi:Helix-turn-helix domain (DUF4817) [Popillia japonica]|uniref:Helix-turn-helix domain (DUF4817) n=1 Tax=Popillia japonica TaxID=7064 RepID=A0AAW1JM08_POPJA